MRNHFALLAASVFVLAGCSGSHGSRQGVPKTRGCSSLTADDVERVANTTPHKLDLNPSPTENIRCSTVFFAGQNELIVSVTEREGGAKGLRRLRARKVAEVGAASVRPASGLGQGAFVAQGRIISFRKGETVVTLETGYSSSGRKLLTLTQLERLAQIVGPHL
jgi:hypothetical protein